MFEWFKKKAAKRVEVPAPIPTPAPVAVAEKQQTYNRHIGYIIVKDNISLTIDGKPYSIGRSHANFDKIVAALKAEQFNKIEGLVNVAATITRRTKGKVTVDEFGEVFHNGKPIHNVVATRIREFVKAGLPFDPLVRFLENLMTNPSERSIEQLYAFLEHGGFPITPDGCFLAYKGVTEDFKDKHTRKFDNKIGSINEMDRKSVDPNPNAACSVGFHVGTHKYAEDFARDGGGQLVMVKVNPADAVSVPHDHSCEKLRVCKYEVVAMCPGKIVEPLSTIGSQAYDLPEDWSEEDTALLFDDDSDDTDDLAESNDLDDYDDEDAETQVAVQAPKRAACTYCGAKGGKKHANSCGRPQKQ